MSKTATKTMTTEAEQRYAERCALVQARVLRGLCVRCVKKSESTLCASCVAAAYFAKKAVR